MPRLSVRVRDALAIRRYSPRTAAAYLGWIRRYWHYCGRRDPAALGEKHATAFLTHLAVHDRVAAATQGQALAAILFLYRHVLEMDLPWLQGLVRASRPKRLPTVLAREEVRALLEQLHGTQHLMALLLYGAGLRLLECCRLRIKDLDFAASRLTIRSGKGDKDRHAILPVAAREALAEQVASVLTQHTKDLVIWPSMSPPAGKPCSGKRTTTEDAQEIERADEPKRSVVTENAPPLSPSKRSHSRFVW